MTVATTLYGRQVAPWDSPLSFGIQAFVEVNGYVLNDRHQADRIRVTTITGLDDADVNVSSEKLPGQHGEVAYDGWYGGRTLVFTGAIEAGSLGVLKRLERDLKASFAPLVEQPIKLRWFDILDGFDDTSTLQNYTGVGTTTGITVNSGTLRWGTTSNVLLIRTSEQRLYGDAQHTLRFVPGLVSNTSSVSLIPSYKDSTDYLSVSYQQTGGVQTLVIATVVGGTTHTLATLTIPFSSMVKQGQSAWLRCRDEGDLVTAELWNTPPSPGQVAPVVLTTFLTGSDADAYGESILSSVGFGAHTADSNWALDDYKIESICPADVVFNARKISKVSISDQQSSLTRFSRNYQVTVRASQFRALGATQTRSLSLVPVAVTNPVLGRSYSRSYPLGYRSYLSTPSSQSSNILSIKNRGTVFTLPVIVVYGAASGGFSIVNLVNGQQMSWTGTLADGDYLVFDCYNRTCVNSGGANQMQYFVASGSWIQLEPDWNDLLFIGSGYSGNTKMLAFLNHTWL